MTNEEIRAIRAKITSELDRAKENLLSLIGEVVDENPLHSNMEVVWGDWFAPGVGFRNDKWSKEDSTYGDGNNELQAYHPDNVEVVDGVLRLTADYGSHRGRTVVSGMVRAKGMEMRPGDVLKFSFRIMTPDGVIYDGLWPAVWASSWTPGRGWPAGGEFDALEVMSAIDSTRMLGSIHWQGEDGRHRKRDNQWNGQLNDGDFRHISVLYGEHGFTWELNHDPSTRFTVPFPENATERYPFKLPITNFKINLACGGSPGYLDPKALGSALEVGYIQVMRSK